MTGELFGPDESQRPRGPATPGTPLADRMRPRTFEELVGQESLFAPGAPLTLIRDAKHLSSLILWGPPGTGKTTLARLIAQVSQVPFESFSAVLSGIKEVKEVMARAAVERRRSGRPTLVFVDEIHRFNRAQQDAFLSYVESGDIVLIGATTENPSFEVNSALLSRSRVVVLEPLGPAAVLAILERALEDHERGVKPPVAADPEALAALATAADGDARRGLNTLEIAATAAAREPTRRVTIEHVRQALARPHLRYDRSGEEHYNLISALHKSLRDSDPHAGLYWLARMLAAGEEPLYVARRLVRFASEDVGNADPHALPLAVAAFEAYHQLGSPEGELALAQCAVYLATAPKSNAVYRGYGAALEEVKHSGSLPPPLVLRNAPTGLMKNLGYGAGYRYAHDEPGRNASQQHFPDEMGPRRFYEPTEEGFEAEIARRMKAWERLVS